MIKIFQRRHKKNIKILLIISNVRHYCWQNKLYAYGPYAREIDVWAEIFPSIYIAAPCRYQLPVKDSLPFFQSNIKIFPLIETGGDELRDKVYQLIMLPILVYSLIRVILKVDAVCVRCPANLGLLGVILSPIFTKYRVAKYAGQWNNYKCEIWTNRLQKIILKSKWWNAPVLIYGYWPNQPKHIISFFTSIMTREQIKYAGKVAENKTISLPLRILYVGMLEPWKRVDVLLKAIKIIVEKEKQIEVIIVGDGSKREELHNQTVKLGLIKMVNFIGALPFEEVLKLYEWAHCLILPSLSEGWPKVIAEAMCYGVVCIAISRGQIPEMLENRGILLKNGTPEEIATALLDIINNPEKFTTIRHNAYVWVQKYSLEDLKEAIKYTLEKWWRIKI